MDDDKRRSASPGRRPAAGKKKADDTRAAKPLGRASAVATDERAKKKSARLLLQRASRRPRAAEQGEGAEDGGGRLFVTALARGLEVLSAFRAGDGALGNLELARRTELPKPTISRITHTLTQLGYLSYNSRLGTYELGGRTLTLGYAALANLDIRRVARPIMQELAETYNLHIALAVRDKLMMLNLETCEGHGLVGLRLAPGTRVPMAITAIGKAYLAAISEVERGRILDSIRKQYGDDWPMIMRSIETSIREVEQRGFCVSMGEWRKDINAVGAAVAPPGGETIYALSCGGPAYLVSQDQLENEYGPALAAAAAAISASLGSPKT
ncbi:MAG: IclR family transcriptional regulator [Rhodopseudomonas sp.]|uniref:IclR family transcriptional regulator n=1 Tax=Rhodopseudomonas sp. TaxID=1078 RepID=UPI0018330CDB|nr:IclR family transcriptional regulator [Rhodopseudomonas sp.]NVN88347.1 IclR family transcriptional regulator [Rhodopseudomonas sp.]